MVEVRGIQVGPMLPVLRSRDMVSVQKDLLVSDFHRKTKLSFSARRYKAAEIQNEKV